MFECDYGKSTMQVDKSEMQDSFPKPECRVQQVEYQSQKFAIMLKSDVNSESSHLKRPTL